MNKKDGDEAVEKLNYFVYDNDLRGLQPCIDKDLDKVIDSISGAKARPGRRAYAKLNVSYLNEYELKSREMEWATNHLGLGRFKNNRYSDNSNFTYYFGSKNKGLITTKGSDYAIAVNNYNQSDNDITLDAGNIKIREAVNDSSVYTLFLDKEHASFNVKHIADSLLKTKDKLKAYHDNENPNYQSFVMPGRLLSFTKQTARFKVTLQITNLSCSYDAASNETGVNFVEGWYLISFSPKSRESQ